MWQRQREAASILKCWSRITAKGVSIENREMEEPEQESGIQGTSRWARPTEVVSAVRHWMTINFHLIGFIWNSYFSFSLPLILSSISISITLPRWLSLFPSLLVALLHDCCGFYSSRVALAPNTFFSFSFLLFLTISRRFFVGVVENFHLLYVIFFCNFCDFNFILIFA